MLARSRDNGRTWSKATTIFSMAGWDCGGGNRLLELPNGDLLIFVFQARWRRPLEGGQPGHDSRGMPDSVDRLMESRETHTFPLGSKDAGRTWEMFGPEVRLFGQWTESAARHRLHQLADGRWMMPAYGSDGPAQRTYAIVTFSRDEGRSWTERAILASNPVTNFHESALVRLPDGSFLAVIRTQDPPFALYRCLSDDDGRTWSTPVRTGILGQTPELLALDSGAILCAYRDRSPSRPGVSYSISGDGGVHWSFGGRIYRARHWNCGYPSMVRLPSGEIICVYYTAYGRRGCQVRGVLLRDHTERAASGSSATGIAFEPIELGTGQP